MFADSQICTLCICNNIMGLKKEKPQFFSTISSENEKGRVFENFVLLIFTITITGEVVRMMTSMTTMPQDKVNFLPEAHTCFNQLVLPDYKKKVMVMEMVTTNYADDGDDCVFCLKQELLQEKLTIAISNAEGFGLE